MIFFLMFPYICVFLNLWGLLYFLITSKNFIFFLSLVYSFVFFPLSFIFAFFLFIVFLLFLQYLFDISLPDPPYYWTTFLNLFSAFLLLSVAFLWKYIPEGPLITILTILLPWWQALRISFLHHLCGFLTSLSTFIPTVL